MISDIAPDLSVFDVMSYTKVFHNVKSSNQSSMYRDRGSEVFYNDCSIPGAQMLEIVKNKEFMASSAGNVRGSSGSV